MEVTHTDAEHIHYDIGDNRPEFCCAVAGFPGSRGDPGKPRLTSPMTDRAAVIHRSDFAIIGHELCSSRSQ